MVASSHDEAEFLKDQFPELHFYTVLTPGGVLPGDAKISRYVWAPSTAALPARVRLGLRGVLSSRIDAHSEEDVFPEPLFD